MQAPLFDVAGRQGDALMEVVALSPALGAEIRGVDASKPVSEAVFA